MKSRSQPLRTALIEDTSVPIYNFLKEEVGQVTLPKVHKKHP